ncbi:MAG: hypothetical protein ACE5R4_14930 [Armatimonadota bacterium]
MRIGLLGPGRCGSILVQVTIALVVLLGMAALALDVTRLHVAAQRAQAVADGAALAAVAELPDAAAAAALALEAVAANNDQVPEWQAVVGDGDLTYYPPGSTIYDADGAAVMELGPYASGVGVRAQVRVAYAFAPLLNLHQGLRTREAVAVQGPAGAICAVPIWISEDSNPGFGQPVDLLYDDLKGSAGIAIPPGSFGFLDFATPGYDWFGQLLRGYDIADPVRNNAIVRIGQLVTAYTGVNTGKWVHALEAETGGNAGTARLERAANEPWRLDTFEDHPPTNPHIIMVPVVSHEGGTGTGATFKVSKFAVFWLDEVGKTEGGNHYIGVRFIEYQYSPDAILDPNAPYTGIFARKLIL